VTGMSRMHICGEGCYDSDKMIAWICYSGATEEWSMGTNYGSYCVIIRYCPFCGLELSLELRAEQDDERRSHTEPEPIPF